MGAVRLYCTDPMLRRVMFALLATVFTGQVQAQFTDHYSLTPPAEGYYTVTTASSFGAWTATNQGAVPSYFSTSSSSFMMLALSDSSGTTSAQRLLITPLQAATVSFSWSLPQTDTQFQWTTDSGA